MNNLAFLDTEIDPKNQKILDIGCVKGDGSQFHKNSVAELIPFINGSTYVCGHNILRHDIKYIGRSLYDAGVSAVIDTLFLSPLLFPTKPYHAL
jgi:ATP-dependent DNA helicase RecQ